MPPRNQNPSYFALATRTWPGLHRAARGTRTQVAPVKLTLYYAPTACSLVPYVALKEAGAEFDVQLVNFRRRTHLSEEYLRLNPKHKVPVLVVDGLALTENVAILQWIARRFPAAQLLPNGDGEFEAIALLAWFASGIHPTLTPNVLPHRYCDLPGSEESVRRCAQRLMLENYSIAERRLAGREWFFEHFTLADAYFFWCFRRGIQFEVDVTPFLACRAHFERVQARASVRDLLAFEAATLAQQATEALARAHPAAPRALPKRPTSHTQSLDTSVI